MTADTTDIKPRTFARPRRLAHRLKVALVNLSDNLKTHRQMARLSDHHLRDIGLTAADRDSLQDTPLSAQTADDLARRARSRSGNW